jgi:hypothetical protein
MKTNLVENYRHFAGAAPHETKTARPRAVTRSYYSEDAAMEAMALMGLALFTGITILVLVAFSII